jgi:hypothetical protein
MLFSTRELRARGGFVALYSGAADLAASMPLLLLGNAGFVNETCGFHSIHDTTETSQLDLAERLDNAQNVADLVARTVECEISDPVEQKLLIRENNRWAACGAISTIAELRRRGLPLATAIHEIWPRRRQFLRLGIGDILGLARALAIIALPRRVVAWVARVKNAARRIVETPQSPPVSISLSGPEMLGERKPKVVSDRS